MIGADGVRVGDVIRVWAPRTWVVSVSSKARQIGIYLYRKAQRKWQVPQPRTRTICIGLFMVAVTGVDGADVFLRGGVGGRYDCGEDEK